MEPKDASGEEMLISSTDFLSSLSREEEERPRSLRIHRYSEEETTGHLLTRFDHFYGEMMAKIRTLRSVPVLERERRVEVPAGTRRDEGTRSPRTRERFEAIDRADEEIRSVTEEYRTAREERIGVQREMCEEVSRNGDSRLFLDLCRFELSASGSSKPRPPSHLQRPQGPSPKTGSFVRRNIQLAKEGSKASYSLTDEEKVRIEKLLEEEEEDEEEKHLNPFLLSGLDEARVREIGRELSMEELLEGMRSDLEGWRSRSDSCARTALRRIDDELERLRTEVASEKTDLPEKEEDLTEGILRDLEETTEEDLEEDMEELLRSTGGAEETQQELPEGSDQEEQEEDEEKEEEEKEEGEEEEKDKEGEEGD